VVPPSRVVKMPAPRNGRPVPRISSRIKALASAGVHHLRLARIDRQRVHGDVHHRFGNRPPPRPAHFIEAPDATRDTCGEDRVGTGRMKAHDPGAATDIAGPERFPCVEDAE
jgi:hypothetical protein